MRTERPRRLRTRGRNLGTRDKPDYREFTELQMLILRKIFDMGLRYFNMELEMQERLIYLAIRWSIVAGPAHVLNRDQLRVKSSSV
jgi:hypothetical protein